MVLIHFALKTFFFCLLQSMVAFLKDPEGAPLWEEDPEAKDIVHIDSEKVRQLEKCSVCFINIWNVRSVHVCLNS